MSDARLLSRGEERVVRLERDVVWIDGRKVPFRTVAGRGGAVSIELEGRFLSVRVAREGDRVFVASGGQVYEVRRDSPRAAARSRRSADHGAGLADLIAPMPGRIRKALVRAGDLVERGQVVLVLEAMKMEHAIRAPRDGTVTRLDHAEGDLVEAGAVLAEIG